jgi:hypothetical protein
MKSRPALRRPLRKLHAEGWISSRAKRIDDGSDYRRVADRIRLTLIFGPVPQLFRIEAERLKLSAPFSRRIAKPLDADAAGQATFYGCFDKVGCQATVLTVPLKGGSISPIIVATGVCPGCMLKSRLKELQGEGLAGAFV